MIECYINDDHTMLPMTNKGLKILNELVVLISSSKNTLYWSHVWGDKKREIYTKYSGKGKLITKFIYNYDWVVLRVREICRCDLIRPSATRCATFLLL